MTNREKFAKEILDIACAGYSVALKNGIPCKCNVLECNQCDLYGRECIVNFEAWSKSEYVEPAVDWSKIPVDTPILVRNNEDAEWNKRHFAEFKNGVVYTFFGGLTSWSVTTRHGWNFAKLADKDNLNKNSIFSK